METSRRSFLKIGGVFAVGLGSLRALDAVDKKEALGLAASRAPEFMANPQALTAKRWAMVVDMKKCWEKEPGGCRDCIAACDWAHNIPDITDKKEEIKWIWQNSFEETFPDSSHNYEIKEITEKRFLVLCNQCTSAPCVRVCPTKATFKNSEGVTLMDYHRCIGCRYCMAACPYGARSFNFRDPRPYIKKLNPAYPTRERGVVEKCDFCAARLAMGKIPACVEACKYKALLFGDLDDPKSEVREALASHFTLTRRPELGTGPAVYYII